jgi:hypothetical protein
MYQLPLIFLETCIAFQTVDPEFIPFSVDQVAGRKIHESLLNSTGSTSRPTPFSQ